MDFNPHEREARDNSCGCELQNSHDFNPHEREARDLSTPLPPGAQTVILIHTSVKLVTRSLHHVYKPCKYFNPHEREARDDVINRAIVQYIKILIHTSVKLVTKCRSRFACCISF